MNEIPYPYNFNTLKPDSFYVLARITILRFVFLLTLPTFRTLPTQALSNTSLNWAAWLLNRIDFERELELSSNQNRSLVDGSQHIGGCESAQKESYWPVLKVGRVKRNANPRSSIAERNYPSDRVWVAQLPSVAHDSWIKTKEALDFLYKVHNSGAAHEASLLSNSHEYDTLTIWCVTH